MQEYARVNNCNIEQAQARSSKAKKAASARWSNAKPMLEHAIIGIDKDKGIGIGKSIDRAAYNNYINNINPSKYRPNHIIY